MNLDKNMKTLIEKLDKPLHAVILNSGGIDSRVTAALAKEAGYILHSIFIESNPEIKEVSQKAAAETAALYCEDHYVFDFPVDWRVKKLNGNFTVPFSAMLLHVLGAQYTVFMGYNYLFFGARREGRRMDYFSKLENLMDSAFNTRDIKLLGPVYNMELAGVIKEAKRLNVKLETTHSCGNSRPCGVCPVCVNRKKFNL